MRSCLKIFLIWILRIGYVLFALAPIYGGIIVALTPYANLMEPQLTPKYWHFKNFTYLINRTSFSGWMRNSIVYSLIAVFCVVVLAIPIAYGFARKHIFKSRIFLFVLLLLQMLSPILIMPSVYSIFNSLGMLNNVWGLILALTASNLSLTTWLLLGFFANIPYEIEESAMIDGASLFQVFIRIVLPLAAPGIAVSAMYAFINTYNDFVMPLFLLNNEKLYPVTLGLVNMLGEVDIHWNHIAAGSLLGLIPPLVFFIFAHRYIIEGLTSGATKF